MNADRLSNKMQHSSSHWTITFAQDYFDAFSQDYFDEMTTSTSNLIVLVMWPVFNVLLVRLLVNLVCMIKIKLSCAELVLHYFLYTLLNPHYL